MVRLARIDNPGNDESCRSDLASNFQTRERAKRANSSLDQVDTKMISEIAFLSQSASTTRISVVNSDWLSNNWLW